MKQRIEELVNQSKFFANDERRYLERVHNREYSQDEWQDICFEKFAELIVQECIRLCDQVDLVGADDCIDNIKQHFEIEE
jgi:hypothetical protein